MTDTINPTTVAQRLQAGAAALREINAGMEEAISALRKTGDLPDVCRNYKAMNDAYEALDVQRKALYEKLEGMSRGTIPEMLVEEGVSNITLEYADGLKYRFGKSQRMSCSMPDKDGGMDWLKANGGEGLIKPTVNASQLSSFAKEYLATQGKDLPADFFKTSTMVYTSVTKA